MDTLVTKLTEARDLLADPEHWTQGEYAIANTGEMVPLDLPEAYAFCAYGALAKVCGVTIDENGEWCNARLYNDACEYLNQAASDVGLSVPEINDEAEDNREVLRLYDQALSKRMRQLRVQDFGF